MKLSEYAQKVGVRYETAWRWFKAGTIRGHQLPTGTIIITEDETTATAPIRVAIYARVSAAEHKPNLDTQADRLVRYCAAKGYQVHVIIKEIGSGVNDSRPKFLKLLADSTITHIVVEHKDRATRFGFRYIETLLQQQGRTVEVVNQAENGKEDLITDLVAIVSSFAARLYGQRRAKRKTDVIVKALTEGTDNAAG
ncbi:IS607 family transposase [Chloroflexales bacterium ZM16-3]|nr:IS607 family transposase [Chloroflexales bacterium ZM16-3]